VIVQMAQFILHSVAFALFLATIPGTFELLLFTIGASRRGGHPLENSIGNALKLAVIVPVHNEERGLSLTLQSLLECDDPVPAKDIVVMACNTTDRSVSIARAMGCTALERIDPVRRGKGYGLDHAFRALEGRGYDGYLIVDADTTVEHNFLNAFRCRFSLGAEAGQCILRVANAGTNSRTRLLNMAFLAFTLLRPLARERLGLSAGIFGNGFGISAETIKRVPYYCYSITEDLEYHLSLVKAGVRVQFVEETTVKADMMTTSDGARTQRERWEGGRLHVILKRAPRLIKDAITMRRLALIEPLLDLLLLPLAYHTLFLLTLAVISAGLMRTYAVAGIVLVVAHICQALILGKATRDDWKAFFLIPKYVGWKVVGLGRTVRTAGKSAPWTRTERLRRH
jgi:cellulose synthase/poly-beta-1,6-N-acetylglucosamine synthase-like glycosyltransferase